MYDLIVIGAGPGGYEAAAHAREMGKQVLLIEKEELGGTCLNVGCIPTKTLLRSAKIYSDCCQADLYGVTTQSPRFDMAKVQARKREVIQTLVKGIGGMLTRHKVEILKATARIVAANCVEADGKRYETRNILIATGSAPAVPPIPGIDSAAVLDSTGILELTEVPQSLVVIGGGVIGLEFAGCFAELGTAVTVVEMRSRIAPVIDDEIAKRLQVSMKKRGVTFHLSAAVTAIDGNVVTFKDAKGESRTLDCTWVLNATGRVPVVNGLGLETIGLDFNRRQGIRTDELGKTNVPGVWACGDVTGRCLLAHSATREGIVAVNNMFGRPDRMRFSAIPSVIYTHPEVAGVGATEEELIRQGIVYKKTVMPMAIAGRFLVEYPGESGTVKVLTEMVYGRIVGVHMIGGGCGEFIATAAAMVEKEWRPQDIREIIFPHPTISEALKETIIRA